MNCNKGLRASDMPDNCLVFLDFDNANISKRHTPKIY